MRLSKHFSRSGKLSTIRFNYMKFMFGLLFS